MWGSIASCEMNEEEVKLQSDPKFEFITPKIIPYSKICKNLKNLLFGNQIF